jgi:branched-chain amino acid aminotransferase
MIGKVDWIWLDGQMVRWDEAQVHVLTHSLHYGLSAFEGIRCYKRDDGRSVIFRLKEHVKRLVESCRIVLLNPPFSQDELVGACCRVIRENKMADGYIRPIVFVGDGEMGVGSIHKNKTRVAVAAYFWGAYLGDEGLKKGIRCKVSSYTRYGVNSAMTKAKVAGHYVNSILANREAVQAGCDEALLLDAEGYVTEGSGENIFVVKDGVLRTPPTSTSLLVGITRDTVLQLARSLGYPVDESPISRDELYIADEIFLTGTAAEVTPVREVDNRAIGTGEPGPMTMRLQEAFFHAIKGDKPPHPEWLTFV